MDTLIVLMFLSVVIIGIGLLIGITLTRRGHKTLDKEKYRARWLAITGSITDTSGSWQFAVMNADKLLDMALAERGVPGTTMGERLKHAKPYLRNLDGVWRAHKLRNRIAHDHDSAVSKREASKAMDEFKAALTQLGAL